MANYNQCIFIGNLTRDVQLSYLPSQTALAEFGLAVNSKYKDKDNVLFIDCRCFGKQAEALNKYTSKGDPIFVSGRLDLDSWEAQDGTKRSRHKLTVERFQFLSRQQKQTEEADEDIGF